jgi:hypothetical protein
MNGKIKTLHLGRPAYVYIRQSTSTQVHEHVESKHRQYALAERAVSLGWTRERRCRSSMKTRVRAGRVRKEETASLDWGTTWLTARWERSSRSRLRA